MANKLEWHPINEAHSILAVYVAIKFAQPVNDVPWARILKQGREVGRKARLPIEQSIQAHKIQIDVSAGAVPTVDRTANAGIEMVRFRTPEFYEEKLTITRDEIRFESWIYTRWRAFSDRFISIFDQILPLFTENVSMSQILVQYVDRFNALNTASDAREIIDVSSPYLVSAAIKPADGWHSQAGWFEAPDKYTRRLTNVDVNQAFWRPLPDAPSQRFIQIRTAKTDMFNLPDATRLPEGQPDVAFVRDRCETLHKELKEALGVVLTAAASERISLGGTKE